MAEWFLTWFIIWEQHPACSRRLQKTTVCSDHYLCAEHILDLLFVVAFGMGVTGVAVATVTSQVISALIVTVMLLKPERYMC